MTTGEPYNSCDTDMKRRLGSGVVDSVTVIEVMNSLQEAAEWIVWLQAHLMYSR